MTVHDLGEIGRLLVDGSGDAAVAQVEGEIDLSNAEELVEHLHQSVPPGAAGLAVDLSTASYFDSAGIRGLFTVQAHLERRRQQLALVVPEDSVLRSVLEATGVHQAIGVYADRRAAVAAITERYGSPAGERQGA